MISERMFKMGQRRLEVLSFGETIVDFLPAARGRLRHVDTFRKVLGGAPGNVAVGLSRLGVRAGLMCKIGEDEFGRFLFEQLEHEGVDITHLQWTDEAMTAVTFVTIDETGDRSFTSFRGMSADTTLRIEEVDPEVFSQVEMMVLGTNLLIREPSRSATLFALSAARDNDVFVAIDPNVRAHLWDVPEEMVPTTLDAFSAVDLVKINDEELEVLGDGCSARDFYLQELQPRGVLACVATHAAGGAEVFCGDLHTQVGAPPVDVVDTTGAGDGFVAGMMAGICALTDAMPARGRETLRAELAAWDTQTWARVMSLGCHVGSFVCTRLGATPGLPRRAELPFEDLLDPKETP